MPVQYGATRLNAFLSTLITDIGASATIEFRTGSSPTTLAAADTGTLVATINLPAAPFTTPTGGIINRDGTWEVASPPGGTAGYWRIKNGSTVILQDNLSPTVVVTAGQPFRVQTLTIDMSGKI